MRRSAEEEAYTEHLELDDSGNEDLISVYNVLNWCMSYCVYVQIVHVIWCISSICV